MSDPQKIKFKINDLYSEVSKLLNFFKKSIILELESLSDSRYVRSEDAIHLCNEIQGFIKELNTTKEFDWVIYLIVDAVKEQNIEEVRLILYLIKKYFFGYGDNNHILKEALEVAAKNGNIEIANLLKKYVKKTGEIDLNITKKN